MPKIDLSLVAVAGIARASFARRPAPAQPLSNIERTMVCESDVPGTP
jgi:hypothetical protein